MPDTTARHDAADLTRLIETRYHPRHRAQLPPLLKMAEMVEDLHETDAGVPKGLHDALDALGHEVEALIIREEAILFPAIRTGTGPGVEAPLAVIRAAHESQRNRIAEIRRLTRDLTLPEAACTSWATLYAGLATFIEDLTTRMRLENEGLLSRSAQ